MCVGDLLSELLEPEIAHSVKEGPDFLILINPDRVNVQQAPGGDLCKHPRVRCSLSRSIPVDSPKAAIQRKTVDLWSVLFRPVMASENSFDLNSVLRNLHPGYFPSLEGQEVNLYLLRKGKLYRIKDGTDYCRFIGCGFQGIQLNAAAQTKLESVPKDGLDFLMISLG